MTSTELEAALQDSVAQHAAVTSVDDAEAAAMEAEQAQAEAA